VREREGDRAFGHDIAQTDIGGGILPERHDPLMAKRPRDPASAGVVGGDDDGLSRRVAEADEAVVEGVARLPVVEVVGIDVGDQRDRRVVQQERAVGLVGFDDEQLVAARAAGDAEIGDDSPFTNVGAVPSARRAVTSMPVDVVLPCAPATLTSRRLRSASTAPGSGG
jgi:hypothetical protein